MSIHPNSSFPLLASDQEDVIRIFLELMQEHEQRVQLGPRQSAEESFFPGDTFDYE
jgi:hypothetical protein